MRPTRLFSLIALAGSLALTGCADTLDAPIEGETVVQAVTVPVITFDRDFNTATPSSALIAGGYVELSFDGDRFYDVIDEETQMGFFAQHYHCYGYGCCEVEFPAIEVHYRFDDHSAFQTDEIGTYESYAIQLPADAERLEVYYAVSGFEMRTWYCGCDRACSDANRDARGFAWFDHNAWDSRWGQNYVFDVEDSGIELPELSRLAHGEWITDAIAPYGYQQGWFWDANVWIDLSVEAFGDDRTAGVRWTVDGWANWRDTTASYERTLEGGREQWGVDLTSITRLDNVYSSYPDGVAVEYAAFYTVDGHTYWDNNDGQNYRVELTTDYHE